MSRSKEVLRVILAIILVIIIMFGAIFIVTYKPNKIMKPQEDYNPKSKIVSTDPMLSATNFIKANGTIGDLEEDVTIDKLITGEAVYENEGRRIKTFREVEVATIPGSPLITGVEKAHIKRYSADLNTPNIYRIENIEVSEPSEQRKLLVQGENNNIEYNAVDVFVSFDSIKTYFTHATDTSYDGTHTQMDNLEHFEQVKVTLVQSGELWFIYDVEDAEYLMNERFATWSGVGVLTINYELSKEISIIKIPGVIPE